MKDVDFTIPIIVSGVFTLLLFFFYLYKKENRIVMNFLSGWFMKTRYTPAELQKDTRKQDSFLLVVLVVLILAFSFKFITFQVVVSDSMKPVFERGDMVLSQAISKEPHVGDIATFKARDVQNPITHRIVGIQGNSVTTKGDNNPLPDGYDTTTNDIIAKAVVIDGQPIVLKGVGSYFILDFTQQGAVSKYGDKFTFLQQMFQVIRTWGYVITIIAFAGLLMSMAGKR
jgi:signal peptidase